MDSSDQSLPFIEMFLSVTLTAISCPMVRKIIFHVDGKVLFCFSFSIDPYLKSSVYMLSSTRAAIPVLMREPLLLTVKVHAHSSVFSVFLVRKMLSLEV